MSASFPPALARYGVVPIAVVVVVGLALDPILGPATYLLTLWPAVLLCAWYGGLWPGLLATGLAGLGAAAGRYVLHGPARATELPVSPTELLGLLLFLLMGALVSGLGERLRTARQQGAEEERRAEEAGRRLRDTLASIRDGVITTDTEGRVTFLNPIAEVLTGWSCREAVGHPLGSVFRVATGAGRTPATASVEGVLRKGGTGPMGQTAKLLARDGGKRPIESSAGRIEDENGAVAGVVVVFRDISERQRLEEQLRQAQKMEVVGRLAGGVAHDFNNLLTAINGYSDLLLEDLPAEGHEHEQVAEIRKAGERAARLTRQLLTFGRQQVVAPQVLDLNALVQGAAALLQRVIGEDVKLATALDPDLARVKADRGQLEQVLLNLAVNARDAMPTGGRLQVRTQNAPEIFLNDRPCVLLEVTDSGRGMDEETLRHLFEPFFTTKPVGQGTGLGLATVYAIVKQAGGSIEVDSEPGRGTTFRVYLPATEGAGIEERSPGISPVDAPGGSETVLLVEDEDAVRALARIVLRQAGYNILDAGNGTEALQVCAAYRGPIHLLVSDVVMPEFGGRELAERLAEEYPQMKVLFMSGYTDDAVVRHGVLRDEMAFLQKPFTPAALARKVREVLDTARPGVAHPMP